MSKMIRSSYDMPLPGCLQTNNPPIPAEPDNPSVRDQYGAKTASVTPGITQTCYVEVTERAYERDRHPSGPADVDRLNSHQDSPCPDNLTSTLLHRFLLRLSKAGGHAQPL